jgi:hypothetical protein
MNCHIKGAAAIVVLGAFAGFCEANVPVRKVRFVSGTPLWEKFDGL